jgi:hypothetical protein
MKKTMENEQVPIEDKNNNKQVNSMLIANVDAEAVKDKYPSLRFSEEVYFMVHVLNTHLKEMQYVG